MARTSRSYDKLLHSYTENRNIAVNYDYYHDQNNLFEMDTTLLDSLLAKPGHLLDVGCGTGRHMLHFARRGFSVTGLDLSEHMVQVTRGKFQEANLIGRLFQGDIRTATVLPDNGFQSVICMFSTLGLIGPAMERDRALQTINRCLVDGGDFIFHLHNALHSLTNAKGRSWFLKSLLGSRGDEAEFGDKFVANYRSIERLYIHVFRRGEIRRMLKRNGFEQVKLLPLNKERNGLASWGKETLFCNGFVIHARKVRDIAT